MDKKHITKIVIAADGKIYDLLIKLMSEFGDLYNFVCPVLGEFHMASSYMRCIFRKNSGLFLESLAQAVGFHGATLIKLIKVKEYR